MTLTMGEDIFYLIATKVVLPLPAHAKVPESKTQAWSAYLSHSQPHPYL